MWNPTIVITFKFKLLTAIGALTLLTEKFSALLLGLGISSAACIGAHAHACTRNVGLFLSEEEKLLLTGAFSPPAAYDVSVYFEWKC